MTPSIRFNGFSDEWVEKKLLDGLEKYTDRVYIDDESVYSQVSVRNHFGGIDLRGQKIGADIGRKRQSKINLTKYPDTLVFTRQTLEQGGIGWADVVVDNAVVTENMPTISLNKNVFSKIYLTHLFQTKTFYNNVILKNINGGSAQIAIHEDNVLGSVIVVPTLYEQQKIGALFEKLDAEIAAEQAKIEQLKAQKQGLLQRML